MRCDCISSSRDHRRAGDGSAPAREFDRTAVLVGVFEAAEGAPGKRGDFFPPRTGKTMAGYERTPELSRFSSTRRDNPARAGTGPSRPTKKTPLWRSEPVSGGDGGCLQLGFEINRAGPARFFGERGSVCPSVDGGSPETPRAGAGSSRRDSSSAGRRLEHHSTTHYTF